MRAGQWRSRVAGALLSALALTWLVPVHAARGIDAQHQPAAPAHMDWFDPEAATPAKGWTPIERTEIDDTRVVLLVHGLDEPGTVWDALAPELASHKLPRIESDGLTAERPGDRILGGAIRRSAR